MRFEKGDVVQIYYPGSLLDNVVGVIEAPGIELAGIRVDEGDLIYLYNTRLCLIELREYANEL